MQLGRPAIIAALAPFPIEPETRLYLQALLVQPSTTRKRLINNLVKNLKRGRLFQSDLFSKLDFLQRYTCESVMDNGMLNIIQPGVYTASPVNSPVFVEDRHIATDGTSSYIDTGFNPSGAGRKYQRDSASFFVWNRREGQSTASAAGWYNTVTLSGTTLLLRSTNNDATGRINHNGVRVTGATITTAIGLTGINRNASQAIDSQIYKNGVLQTMTGGAVSSPIENGNFRCGAITAVNFGSRDFSFCGAGASLNGNEWADLHAALNTYMTDLSIGV